MVTIVNESPASSVQLTNVGTYSLIPTDGGAGISPTLMGLAAGSNISLASDEATNVTISVPPSSFQPTDTQEALTVASGGSTVTNPTINTSFVTVTGSGSGAATGTLANGTVDGFLKTVVLTATDATPYILTISSYQNQYGVQGPYTVPLQQAAASVTVQWSVAAGAWLQVGAPPGPSPPRHRVTVAIDPQATPILQDGTALGEPGHNQLTQTGTTVTLRDPIAGLEFTQAMVGGRISFPGLYTYGTVSQTGNTVTGVSGQLNFGGLVGGTFAVNGYSATITAVSGGNVLTVNGPGTTLPAGSSYCIYFTPPVLLNIISVQSATSLTVDTPQTIATTDYFPFYLYTKQPIYAVADDNTVIASGINAPDISWTTVTTLFNSVFSYFTAIGGTAGDIFIRNGNYYWSSSQAQVTTKMSNVYICGDGNTNLIGDGGADILFDLATGCQYVTFDRLNFNCQYGYTATINFGLPYGDGGVFSTISANYLRVLNCNFNSCGSVLTAGGSTSHCTCDGNTFWRCRGGLQFTGTSGTSDITVTNNHFIMSDDDCINMGSVIHGVVAGNSVDMGYPSFIASGRGTLLTGCTDIAITGNSYQNMESPAIFFDPADNNGAITQNVSIIGNVFYQCGMATAGGTSLSAAVSMPAPYTYNVVISGNSFCNGKVPLYLQGRGNFISGNTYYNNSMFNSIVDGNIVHDVDDAIPTGDALMIATETTTQYSPVLGEEATFVQTPESPTWVAAQYVSPFVIASYTESLTGGSNVSFALGVGCPTGALSGCTLEVLAVEEVLGPNVAATATSPIVFTSEPFTIPQTVGSITDTEANPLLVIPCVFPLSQYQYEYKIIAPGNPLLDVRHCVFVTFIVLCGSVVDGVDTPLPTPDDQFDFACVAQGSTPTPFLTTGEFGNNRGQLALGPVGSLLSQFAMYNVTGIYAAVSANSETITGPVTVTAASGAIPQTTDQIFVSSTGALPVGLLVTGAYCNATGQLTFKVVNFTTNPYAGGDTYSLWFQGVSQ